MGVGYFRGGLLFTIRTHHRAHHHHLRLVLPIHGARLHTKLTREL